MKKREAILLLIILLNCNNLFSDKENAGQLPTIYFGMDMSFGKYRETDYRQYLMGVSVYAGMPMDRFLSAECYADLQVHSVSDDALDFWQNFFEISDRYSFGLTGFRIGSAGGRFNFNFFNFWFLHLGGGLGFFGFNPVVNDVIYQRQTAILYEVELGSGFTFNLSKSVFLRTGVDFKIYFMENAERHEYAVIFDIIGIGYRYYRELF
ncbi:MAG: hypothetical protein JXA66_04130 [Oligoflexia bacterium]|nr:hypothetical protein [Oligoflexia bacterium]